MENRTDHTFWEEAKPLNRTVCSPVGPPWPGTKYRPKEHQLEYSYHPLQTVSLLVKEFTSCQSSASYHWWWEDGRKEIMKEMWKRKKKGEGRGERRWGWERWRGEGSKGGRKEEGGRDKLVSLPTITAENQTHMVRISSHTPSTGVCEWQNTHSTSHRYQPWVCIWRAVLCDLLL